MTSTMSMPFCFGSRAKSPTNAEGSLKGVPTLFVGGGGGLSSW